jgi:hypothetical protein
MRASTWPIGGLCPHLTSVHIRHIILIFFVFRHKFMHTHMHSLSLSLLLTRPKHCTKTPHSVGYMRGMLTVHGPLRRMHPQGRCWLQRPWSACTSSLVTTNLLRITETPDLAQVKISILKVCKFILQSLAAGCFCRSLHTVDQWSEGVDETLAQSFAALVGPLSHNISNARWHRGDGTCGSGAAVVVQQHSVNRFEINLHPSSEVQ